MPWDSRVSDSSDGRGKICCESTRDSKTPQLSGTESERGVVGVKREQNRVGHVEAGKDYRATVASGA